MSTPLAPLPIRLLGDIANKFVFVDLNTGSTPTFVRGDDIQFDLGIGLNGVLLTNPLATSGTGGITGVTLQIFEEENDTNPPVMSSTVAITNVNVTPAQWTTQPYTSANAHVNIPFANTLTAVNLDGATQGQFWLRIFATTSDAPAKQITLLEGSIMIKDGPINALSAAIAAGWSVVGYDGVQTLGLFDPITEEYYALLINTVDNIRSLGLSDNPASPESLPTESGWKIVMNGGVATPALLDPITENFYALVISAVAGIRSVGLGATAY